MQTEISINRLKFVLIGDPGVGKTSLSQQYIFETFTEEYKPTIGVDFISKKILYNNKSISLQIWDTVY